MDNDAKTAVAEPSPATPEIHELTPSQYDNWRKTGSVEEKTSDTPAEKTQATATADPPKVVTSEAKAESATDPEPVTRTQEKKGKPQPKPDAETRISELTARTKQLEQELEAERSRKREADTKPPAKEPAKAEAPKRPNPFNWTGTAEEFEAAQDAWEKHRESEAVREFQQKSAQEAQRQMLAESISGAKQRYADADQVITPALEALMKRNEQGHPEIDLTVAGIVGNSPVMTDLIYALASDPAEFQKFLAEAKSNPGQAIRRAVIVEKLVIEELAKGGDKGKGGEKELERGSDGKFKASPDKKEETPAKTISSAPPPPHEVGGKGTSSPDEVEQALKEDDFEAFKNAENRRALARRKG